MLGVSYGIFPQRRRKIMALIPSKASAGIAALTFAATASLYPAHAGIITLTQFDENPFSFTSTWSWTDNFAGGWGTSSVFPATHTGQFWEVILIGEGALVGDLTDHATHLFAPHSGEVPTESFFNYPAATNGIGPVPSFFQHPPLGHIDLYSLTTTAAMQLPPVGGFIGHVVTITFNGVHVPGPIVGAGLPGLILASGGLLAWWRRRR
jgi:hypothetical protein